MCSLFGKPGGLQNGSLATECERLGAFYVQKKTFNCQLKSGDTP